MTVSKKNREQVANFLKVMAGTLEGTEFYQRHVGEGKGTAIERIRDWARVNSAPFGCQREYARSLMNAFAGEVLPWGQSGAFDMYMQGTPFAFDISKSVDLPSVVRERLQGTSDVLVAWSRDEAFNRRGEVVPIQYIVQLGIRPADPNMIDEFVGSMTNSLVTTVLRYVEQRMKTAHLYSGLEDTGNGGI